ncbi:hypothetical protein AAG570_012776 [Ranatra chinensis]|uniref:Uncharacterized protein n=1 Tax=Ranatra chinensis TaxID=642074 RepID=A0ABD0YTH9_9HEMI
MTLSQTPLDDSIGPGGRRRTERVKREKPNYYDASEFEKKTKKKRLERNAAEASRERSRSSAQPLKKKRKKKLCKSTKEQEEEDPCITLSLEKTRQCSIILAELNRKLFTTTWKV